MSVHVDTVKRHARVAEGGPVGSLTVPEPPPEVYDRENASSWRQRPVLLPEVCLMQRLLTVLGLVLTLSAATVATASAGAPSRGVEPPGRMLGVVPVLEQAKHGARPSRTNNLSYHGGNVMAAGNVTHLIFWGTGFDSGYQTTIEQYFKDVAADGGKSSNVYFSDTQYSSISVSSSYGGSVNDTTPYGANGCTDKATKICLSDAQLQAEVMKYAGSTWPITSSAGRSLFFVFTPKGVGSCYGSSCAYTNFCAYHSWITQPTGDAVLYANQPYADQNYRIYTCNSGQSPNGNAADATLNVASHEHNEAITDPEGSAWYDNQGYENGDKCAWNFGTAVGGSSGALYNQVINGNHYYLQQEWSNNSSGCVLTGS
jgi:hypothetical protein